MDATPPVRRLTLLGLLTAACGVALFVWLVRHVGPAEIWAGFRQIGWWLLAIVALGGARFAARAWAWTLCIEPPHRLRFGDAFAAIVSGDALGNVTPLGPLVSEPAKAAFVRARVPLGPALTALAIENLLYTLSAAGMIAAGTVALLWTVDVPVQIREVSVVAVAAVAAFFAAAAWLAWRQPALFSGSLAALGSRFPARVVDRVRTLEREVYTFAARRGAAMLPIGGAELAFHALGVLEIHLTLWLILGEPPALLTSFILETVNRFITVVFRFVPLRLGVDEAGSGVGTQLLGLGTAPGVTLAIVRKARVLFWSLAGTALLVRHGLGGKRLLEHSGAPPPGRR